MTWFKADDKLHSHRKAIRAGIPAMGLWVIAGSWSADQLTDGFVPDYMALRMDLEAETHAAALVAAGLWEEAEQDGERGWVFHEWAEHQPTKVQVNANRQAAKDRQQRARDRAKEARQGVAQHPDELPRDDATADTNGDADVTEPSRRDESVTHATVTAASRSPRPDPTRPDPTSKNPPTTDVVGAPADKPRTTTARGTRLPDDFPVTEEMASWANDSAPHAGPRDHEAFCDYWRGQAGAKGRKADWIATWRNWMRRASDDHAPRGGARPSGKPTPIERVSAIAEIGARLQAEDDAREAQLREVGS